MVKRGSFNIPGKAHVPNRYFYHTVCHAGEAGGGRHIHHRSARVGCPESYSVPSNKVAVAYSGRKYSEG